MTNQEKMRTHKQLADDATLLVKYLKDAIAEDQNSLRKQKGKRTTEELMNLANKDQKLMNENRTISVNSTRRSLAYAKKNGGRIDRKGRYWWFKNGKIALSSSDLDAKIMGVFNSKTRLSSIDICKRLRATDKVDKDNIRRRLTYLHGRGKLERVPGVKPFEYRLPRGKNDDRKKEITDAILGLARDASKFQESLEHLATLMKKAA